MKKFLLFMGWVLSFYMAIEAMRNGQYFWFVIFIVASAVVLGLRDSVIIAEAFEDYNKQLADYTQKSLEKLEKEGYVTITGYDEKGNALYELTKKDDV